VIEQLPGAGHADEIGEVIGNRDDQVAIERRRAMLGGQMVGVHAENNRAVGYSRGADEKVSVELELGGRQELVGLALLLLVPRHSQGVTVLRREQRIIFHFRALTAR